MDKIAVLKIVATGKRALSDTFNSCEPIPKKLRVDNDPDIDDTASTNSCSSHDWNISKYLMLAGDTLVSKYIFFVLCLTVNDGY